MEQGLADIAAEEGNPAQSQRPCQEDGAEQGLPPAKAPDIVQVQGTEVLETAEEHTIALRAITEQIPSFIKTIEKDVPKRLEELQEASDKFIAEDYILPENVNLKEIGRASCRERV